MVKDLLDAGANFEAKDAEGCSALMLAASVFPPAALLLVQNGAVFQNTDAHHNNVLHFAASSNDSAPLIREIARHREEFARMMSMRNVAGNTPLMVAKIHRSIRTARAMLAEALQKRKNTTYELTTMNENNSRTNKRVRIE